MCMRCISLAVNRQAVVGRRAVPCRRKLSMPAAARATAFKGDFKAGSVLTSFISDVLSMYWDRSPTAVRVLSLIQGLETSSAPIYFDHFAFRTLGVPGMGISSIAKFFTDFGYEERDVLHFPEKHVKAMWYAPPDVDLPRIFISELKVEELSSRAQNVLHKYVQRAGRAGHHAAFLAATGTLPWGAVEEADFSTLESESEYASWCLTHAYTCNHVAVSVHRLQGFREGIEELNDELIRQGVKLSKAGDILKVSPDGGLLQSSTVADPVRITFADGSTGEVSGSYLEFAQRLVLPEFQHLEATEIQEAHRREGFEVGNADKIFESTQLAT